MKLSYFQKKEIYDKGYVLIPNVIPKVMSDEALKAVNHCLGNGMTEEEAIRATGSSYCKALRTEAVITDLFNKTPALPLCESVIGEGKIEPASSGQIAIRFPQYDDPPSVRAPHLDGMSGRYNGIPKGTIANFTAIVAMFLSDVQLPFAGNFTAWPGTHHQYEQYFREHGPEALLNGMPPIDMPEPEKIMAKAGDMVLCNYQIAHSFTTNITAHPRYAIFFRLYHVHHRDDWRAPMTDIWMHWPGIREMLPGIEE